MTRTILMKFLISLAILGMLFLFASFSGIAYAATYHYVNTSGNIQSVEANSPTEAIAIAPNRTPHSGVMLFSGTALTTTNVGGNTSSTGSNLYMFVDANGNLQTVMANNPNEAMTTALNIGVHSGVMLVN